MLIYVIAYNYLGLKSTILVSGLFIYYHIDIYEYNLLEFSLNFKFYYWGLDMTFRALKRIGSHSDTLKIADISIHGTYTYYTVTRKQKRPKINFKRKNLYKCCLETQLYAVHKNLINIRYIEDLKRLAAIISKIPEAYHYLIEKQRCQELKLLSKLS
jgi:hypothetical protein